MINKSRCLKCGTDEIKFRKVKNFETMVKGVPFTIPEASIGFCNSCGEKIFDANEIRRWQELYETELLRSGTLLTASEIKNIREVLGLQINEFARLLGTTRQSVYNWERENRKSPQLRLADLLLRLVHESGKVGPVNVLKYLGERAGIDQTVAKTYHMDRTEARVRRRVGSLRRRESWEYDRVFEPCGGPDELPRLQMLSGRNY